MYRIRTAAEYSEAYRASVDDPEKFWAGIAENFAWKKKWDRVLDWNFEEPSIKWFNGAILNITENCIDRHSEKTPDAAALLWEPNDPTQPARQFTYRELLHEVCLAANVLKSLGVRKGDRVCLYLPMIPELAFFVLACARIGAVHSVIFGGFSASSISDRLNDAGCKLVVTADGGYRGSKTIPLKAVVDEALQTAASVTSCLVIRRTGDTVSLTEGRDHWLDEKISELPEQSRYDCKPEPMQAEDLLFILYTSGSTGKPKGVVHTCGGYMVYAAYSFTNVFQYERGQVHFCTADIGWITGHSYILYGPLCEGATTVMFEGLPTYPDAARLWDIVKKLGVNILFTAPTAIRSLMTYGTDIIDRQKLATLKILGTVGEPINEEAWHWYKEQIGNGSCPITDTWWQTETGGILIANLAGVTPEKPAWATLPLPGVQPVLMDEKGKEISGPGAGNLCLRFPWPGMLRTTYGDHARCRATYFSSYPGYYFTGDGALRDAEGNYRITGRVDDVLNVSGHRLGTAEIENAINRHPDIAESAVVGFPHEIKGEGIYAFVIRKKADAPEESLHAAVVATVRSVIGPIATPDRIQFVSALPKTRSGKIMRRILRKIAAGEKDSFGDTSTLLDPGIVDELSAGKL